LCRGSTCGFAPSARGRNGIKSQNLCNKNVGKAFWSLSFTVGATILRGTTARASWACCAAPSPPPPATSAVATDITAAVAAVTILLFVGPTSAFAIPCCHTQRTRPYSDPHSDSDADSGSTAGRRRTPTITIVHPPPPLPAAPSSLPSATMSIRDFKVRHDAAAPERLLLLRTAVAAPHARRSTTRAAANNAT